MCAPFSLAILSDSQFAWAFPFIFFAFWCTITFIISRFGWSAAAKRFPASLKPEGKAFRTPATFFRYGSHYSSCVKATPSEQGLYLTVEFLFALGHRPMLIPWSAVAKISEHEGWLGGRYLEIAGPDGLTIRLPMSALPKIQPFAESAQISCPPLPDN